MPFIEHQGKLHPLHEGKNVVGGTSRSDVRLPNLGPSERLTIVIRGRKAAVQAGARAAATVNGQPLGADPRGLHHEDRVGLNGATLVFLSEAANGNGASSHDRVDGASSQGPADGADGRGRGSGLEVEPSPVPALIRVEDGQVYPITRSALTIGREKRCDIVVADRSVSRLHAEISTNGGGLVLRDLSRNGTRINGEAARETQPLRIGDVIQVGAAEFRFVRLLADASNAGDDVTPIRSAVPEAPTEVAGRMGRRKPLDLGALVFRWAIILAVAGTLGAVLFLS